MLKDRMLSSYNQEKGECFPCVIKAKGNMPAITNLTECRGTNKERNCFKIYRLERKKGRNVLVSK